MAFLKFFGSRESSQAHEESSAATATASCPHKVLVPRWDSLDDMGREDKASGYKCNACGAVLSREEAELGPQREQAITL